MEVKPIMAQGVLFFILIFHLSVRIAQARDTKISLGTSLSPSTNNSYWSSNSGHFAFGFYKQGDGFVVGIWFQNIQQQTVIWTANRDDPPLPNDAKLFLIGNGLILQKGQGQQIPFAQPVDTTQPVASASMLDSGNFVLNNSDSTIIWQSFDFPTDTLLPTQRLATNKQLVSGMSETNHSSGIFRVLMQDDGNLVQLPIYDWSVYLGYWNSKTNTVGSNTTLILDPSGQLYLLSSDGSNVKNISASPNQTGDKALYRFTIDVDGILRLYSHSLLQNASWLSLWNSTNNKCDPLGLCGLNSYCVLDGQEPHCLCPPNFDFIDQSQRNLGCHRNIAIEGCTTQNGDAVSVEEIPGLTWQNTPYAILGIDAAACKEECLRDCNCEVALFANQYCSKQQLPLRFAKTQQSESEITIIKLLKTTKKSSGGRTEQVRSFSSTNETKKGKRMTIIGVACITFASIILLFSVILLFRSRLFSFEKISNESNEELMAEAVSLRSFTYNELEQATGGFIEPLGRGSFGTVFKGTFAQRAIAVKRLEKVMADGEVEFQNEMRSIGRIHHRNLLHLLGYCHEGSNRLLVYDYMINGSLTNFLFNSPEKPKWNERVGIALGIARGILYLHEDCESQIIHCDINPNNILIDESHSPKIADFGLAKLLMPDQTKTFTGVRGTRGFVAPEWHKNFPITAKVDVFSFGIVLLVIICCRRSVDVNLPEREAILVDWVYECFKANEVKKLIPDEEDEQDFERMVRIGLWCIQEEPGVRPAMKKVVAMFEGTVDIPVPPCLTSSIHSHVID
ncbi:hypothetical protein UlMin_036551 [Ulmus minor]